MAPQPQPTQSSAPNVTARWQPDTQTGAVIQTYICWFGLNNPSASAAFPVKVPATPFADQVGYSARYVDVSPSLPTLNNGDVVYTWVQSVDINGVASPIVPTVPAFTTVVATKPQPMPPLGPGNPTASQDVA